MGSLSAICYLMTLTYVVHLLHAGKVTDKVSCITVSLANWGQGYDCMPHSSGPKKCIICGLYARKYGYTGALYRLQLKLNFWTASSFISYNWRLIKTHGWSDVQRRPLFDNAPTQRRWGERRHILSSKLSAITPGCLGKPGGRRLAQAARQPVTTEDGRPWSVNWGDGLSLINGQATNRSVLTAARACV